MPGGLGGTAPPAAESALHAAGFATVVSKCEEKAGPGGGGPSLVSRVDPPSGTVANRNAQITLTYERAHCP